MNTPNIKVGDILKLRNGTEVKVLETDAPGDYPILCRSIEVSKYVYATVTFFSFTLKGEFRAGEITDTDIILPKRRVPWDKLTDVELGDEYLFRGNIVQIEGIHKTSVLNIVIANGWFLVDAFKHRKPVTTEWLECDKEAE